MQEQRNKRLVMMMVVLLGATAGLFWFGTKKNSDSVNKDLFRQYDAQTIDRVTLYSEAEKVSLHYNGSRWKVNDEHDADSRMIDVLFATLQQVEPKRPVAASMQDSLAHVLEKNGINVSLWSGDQLMESFYTGANESKTQAYFKKAESREVYIAAIPGYRVNVSEIFELRESGWRDKYVFAFNWRNFQSLEVKFQKPTSNFVVSMDKDFFGIRGIAAVDTAKLNDFLDRVSLLSVDEYVSHSPVLDSLSETNPLVFFIVKDIAQREYSLKIFPFRERRRYYGLINDQQWAVFQENKVVPVLRPKEFFIQ